MLSVVCRAGLQDLSWSWGDLCSALRDASGFAHQDAMLRLGISIASEHKSRKKNVTVLSYWRFSGVCLEPCLYFQLVRCEFSIAGPSLALPCLQGFVSACRLKYQWVLFSSLPSFCVNFDLFFSNYLQKTLCKVHHGLKDQLLPAEDTSQHVTILQTFSRSQQAVQDEFQSLRAPNSPRGLSVWYSRSKGRQHRGYHEGALVDHFRAGCYRISECSN